MSTDDQRIDDEDERRLLTLVGDSSARHTSAAHDEAVLAAAQRLARERRRPMRRLDWFGLPAAMATAVVAAIAIGIGVVTLTQYDRPVGNDLLRGDADAVMPANDARLAAPVTEFAWPAQPGASSYVVVLRDATAAVIWTSEPSIENRIALTAEALALLQAPGTYLWSVEVRGVANRELGPFWFHRE